MTNRVTKATTFVAQAQSDLDAALAAGTDTNEARERLRLAQAELSDARTAEATALAVASDEDAARVQQAVAAELETATTAANDAIQAIGNITLPSVSLPAYVLENLIRAQQHHEAIKATMDSYLARVGDLKARLQGLAQEKQDITDRRAAGKRNDAVDGPKLALIDADMAGLQELIARAESDKPSELDAAWAEVSRLKREWMQAQEEAVASALNQYCQRLEANLIEAGTRIAKLTVGIGGIGHRWRPDQRLRNAVTVGVF